MVIAAVGTVRGGGGTAVGNGAEITLFGASGVGAPVFGLLVMKGANGADRVGVLTDWSGVTVPLAVTASSGFVSRVGHLDFSLTGEEEDVRAHLLTLLGSGGDHYRGGVLEGASVGVRVEEASGGDLKALGIEDGRLEVHKQPLGVTGQVPEGEAMDGELILVGSGAEGEPGRRRIESTRTHIYTALILCLYSQ